MATAISKKTPVTIGLVLLICAGCVWVGVTYQSFGNRIENLEKMIKGDLKRQEALTISFNKALREHASIRRDLSKKTKDRWCKGNDLAFTRELCRINNLKMPPHERIIDISIYKSLLENGDIR